MDLLWKFIPELPDTTRELIIAVKGHKTPVQGFMSARKKWCISRNVNDTEVVDQSTVYAWRELPEMPPILTQKTIIQPTVDESNIKTKTVEVVTPTVVTGPKTINKKS